MNTPIKILGIAGSLRKGSYNRAALRAAQQLAPDGTVVEICEIGDFPLFNQDYESKPPAAVADFKAKIRAADAILFASPEYNYSFSGALKNAIDWASRPHGDNSWDGKPAAIMGAAIGMLGTARMQYQLRETFVFLNIHAVNRPEVMITYAAQKFDKDGNLTDQPTRDIIAKLLQALVLWARQLEHGKQIQA